MSLLDLDEKTRTKVLSEIGMTLEEYKIHLREHDAEIEKAHQVREKMKKDGVTGDQISRRILEMISGLHDKGYESLYIDPVMSPSGCNWRYSIGVIVDGFWPCTYNQAEEMGISIVEGSIAGGDDQEIPWGKPDDSLVKFIDAFCATYPELLKKAAIPNSQYVEWYKTMLKLTQPDGILIFGCDYSPYHEYAFTWGEPEDFKMPMPPGYLK